MLSLEEQIIDATTEDGQKALKEFEEHEKGKSTRLSRTEDPE
jgi:cell division cycle protein 37